jgi:glutaminyl-tRNA synthetase
MNAHALVYRQGVGLHFEYLSMLSLKEETSFVASTIIDGGLRIQVIDNLPDNHFQEVKALDFPGRSASGYLVPFTKVCYIEATDFREVDAKDYYGLAPGKSIMLRCVEYQPRMRALDETTKCVRCCLLCIAHFRGTPSAACCRYAYPVKYVSHSKDESGIVTEVHVECDLEPKGKPPKGVVNWIGQPKPGEAPQTAEVRLYADAVRHQ